MHVVVFHRNGFVHWTVGWIRTAADAMIDEVGEILLLEMSEMLKRLFEIHKENHRCDVE